MRNNRILVLTTLVTALSGFSGSLAVAQVAPAPAPTAAPQVTVGGTTNVTAQPSNAQSVNPFTDSNASSANVNTQINTVPLGLYSYGVGIQCPTPQFTAALYQNNVNQNANNPAPVGQPQTGGFGSNAYNFGASIGYQAPIGHAPSKTCQQLGDEILKQKQLDTTLTMISKCGEFAKAGLVLHPEMNPALQPIADVCKAVSVAPGAPGLPPSSDQSAVPQTKPAADSVVAKTVSQQPAPAAAPDWKFAPVAKTLAQSDSPCPSYHQPSVHERSIIASIRKSVLHNDSKAVLNGMRRLQCVDPMTLARLLAANR